MKELNKSESDMVNGFERLLFKTVISANTITFHKGLYRITYYRNIPSEFALEIYDDKFVEYIHVSRHTYMHDCLKSWIADRKKRFWFWRIFG